MRINLYILILGLIYLQLPFANARFADPVISDDPPTRDDAPWRSFFCSSYLRKYNVKQDEGQVQSMASPVEVIFQMGMATGSGETDKIKERLDKEASVGNIIKVTLTLKEK